MPSATLTYILHCKSCGVHGEIDEFTDTFICPECQGEMKLSEVRIFGDDSSIEVLLKLMIDSAEHGNIVAKRTLAFLADSPNEHTRTAVEKALYRKRYPEYNTKHTQIKNGNNAILLQNASPVSSSQTSMRQNIPHSNTSDCTTTVTTRCGAETVNSRAFANRKDLTAIAILEGVTEIGTCAFDGCKNLTSVIIPKSVTEIGSYAFDGCNSLTSVVIQKGSRLRTIGDNAFRNCAKLASPIIIPEGVTEIPICTFDGCKSLPSVVIPKSVTEIGSYAFDGCNSLTSIVIKEGSSLKTIGDNAFRNCAKLASPIIIPEGVTKIALCTFDGCKSLPSVVIPKSVTEIESYAFDGCNSLSFVVIPKRLKKIDSSAFSGCNCTFEKY